MKRCQPFPVRRFLRHHDQNIATLKRDQFSAGQYPYGLVPVAGKPMRLNSRAV